MISEKEYWDILEKIATQYPTSKEFLHAAIPSAFVDDHLEEAAVVAAGLIGAGYLPHQVHSMLMPLAKKAMR